MVEIRSEAKVLGDLSYDISPTSLALIFAEYRRLAPLFIVRIFAYGFHVIVVKYLM